MYSKNKTSPSLWKGWRYSKRADRQTASCFHFYPCETFKKKSIVLYLCLYLSFLPYSRRWPHCNRADSICNSNCLCHGRRRRDVFLPGAGATTGRQLLQNAKIKVSTIRSFYNHTPWIIQEHANVFILSKNLSQYAIALLHQHTTMMFYIQFKGQAYLCSASALLWLLLSFRHVDDLLKIKVSSEWEGWLKWFWTWDDYWCQTCWPSDQLGVLLTTWSEVYREWSEKEKIKYQTYSHIHTHINVLCRAEIFFLSNMVCQQWLNFQQTFTAWRFPLIPDSVEASHSAYLFTLLLSVISVPHCSYLQTHSLTTLIVTFHYIFHLLCVKVSFFFRFY